MHINMAGWIRQLPLIIVQAFEVHDQGMP